MIHSITKITKEDFSYPELSYTYYEIVRSIVTSNKRLCNIAKKYDRYDLWMKYHKFDDIKLETIYPPSLNHTKIGISAWELRRYLKSVNKYTNPTI